MRSRIVVMVLLLASPGLVSAQQPPQAPVNGAAVFERACASCHQAGQTAVPPPEALRALTPEAIVNSLTNGKMAVQGATLTAAEHSAVAQFLTGRAPAAATATRGHQPVHGRDADDGSGAGPTLERLGQRRRPTRASRRRAA